ncbi:MAG: hypothetical protein WBQ86_15360 [Candidatus Binatus sp.]
MTPQAPPTFDHWVKSIFDRPTVEEAWHASYHDNGRWLEQSPAVGLEFVTKLFENPLAYLSGYSDEQINQGVYIIVNTSSSDHFCGLVEGDVDLALRRMCIRSLENLSREVFAPRCSDDVWIYTKPMNEICDLLWDMVVRGVETTERNPDGTLRSVREPDLDKEILDTLARILATPSIACQQSALHGLGHLVDYAGLGSNVIQQYLDEHPDLRSDLREYALNALVGRVM